MDSSDESETKQTHPGIDTQEDLPSQPQTPPPQKLPVNRNQEPLTPREKHTEAESNEDGTPSKQRRCRCKASRCLKLYCECFASGSYCNGCNCLNCHNILDKETERQEAVKATLERNPGAFKPKIADVTKLVTLGKHKRGCNCKRFGCLKKYCECYQAKIRCSESCRCRDCKNFEGSEEIQQMTIDMMHAPELRKRNSASHYVADRVSTAFPHLDQYQTVNYVVRDGDTSLFTIPNNKAVSGSTTGTYRFSPSDTTKMRRAKELCSLLVSKAVDVANKMSDCVLDAGTMNEKPMSQATRALTCDEEHVNISEEETSAGVRTSQEKEDTHTSLEVYLEQENEILSSFRDHLLQLLNRGSINGTDIQRDNTDPSRQEPEDKDQNNRDSSLGA